MARLREILTGKTITLTARSLVGRGASCTVQITSRHVSGEHASIFFADGEWLLRDLGSTNGTHVDERRVAAGERRRLPAGATITFGSEGERWVLDDDRPPTAGARCDATGEVRSAEGGLLALPDAGDPQATMYEDRDGMWWIEVDGERRPAEDGGIVDAGGRWTLHVPPAAKGSIETTVPASALGPTGLLFQVSRDEEFISVSLLHHDDVVPLATRAHHELLLVLARVRLRDREAGLPEIERGWVYSDDVARMLKLDLQQLNLNVFRARQQLASAGAMGVGSWIERRATTRQMRLGVERIEVRSS